MEGPHDGSKQLLVEGAKSYPKALVAVTEFRRIVTNTITGVVTDDLDALGKALGCELSKNDVRARRRPDRIDTVVKAPSLGIKIERDADGWRQYFQVTWWNGDLDAGASIRFLKDPDALARVVREFKGQQAKLKLAGEIGSEEDEVWLSRRLDAEQLNDLEAIMRGVMRDWIRLWSAIGGLSKRAKTVTKRMR